MQPAVEMWGVLVAWFMVELVPHTSWGMVVHSLMGHCCPVFRSNLWYSGNIHSYCLTFSPLFGPKVYVQKDRHAWLLLLCYLLVTRLVSSWPYASLSIRYFSVWIYIIFITILSCTPFGLLVFHNSITVAFHLCVYSIFSVLSMAPHLLLVDLLLIMLLVITRFYSGRRKLQWVLNLLCWFRDFWNLSTLEF